MATPRFVVEKNSPAGLAARAVSLLREQREQLQHALPPPRPNDTADAGPRASEGVTREEGAAEEVPDATGIPRGPFAAQLPPAPPRRRGGLLRDRGGGSAGTGASEVVGLRRQPQVGVGGEESGGDEEGGEERELEEEEEDGDDGVTRRRGKLDPTLFSFWLAANLPVEDDARQRLLLLDSVVLRLR